MPLEAAPINTTWSPAADTPASLMRFASSHVTPSRMCDCGPAEIMSARRFSLICDGWMRRRMCISKASLSELINLNAFFYTCCCNRLNSLGFVPWGTNCRAPSMRTAFDECEGESSATHCRENNTIPEQLATTEHHQYNLIQVSPQSWIGPEALESRAFHGSQRIRFLSGCLLKYNLHAVPNLII